jgi:glycosyltransferase involved in cell wall biosynthesis
VSGQARRRILYVTHNGLTEPLGRRQVLPYLVALSTRGFDITIVSFEKWRDALSDAMERVGELVTSAQISWVPLRYHNRPRYVGTAFDVAQGLATGIRLAHRAELIHARSTVPALLAWLLASASGRRWIFDVRGLLAQEYVDAGHWQPGSAIARLTGAIETRLIRAANGIVTLTHRAAESLSRPSPERPVAVIPCSVDLGTFRPDKAWRDQVRGELGWRDEPVLVYSGSLGSWYRLPEMLDFFDTARRYLSDLRFLILTPQAEIAGAAVRSRRLEPHVVARKLAPDDVPRHLAAADAGICFLGRHASKVASSPTKYAEYLAAGLPVVTNPWIGDAEALGHESAWVLVADFDSAHYGTAAARLGELLKAPEQARAAARELAEREFALTTAVERYAGLYRRVLDR